MSHSAGIGIGLALTKVFVEMHEGTISVDSNRDIGTTFIIDIPIKLFAAVESDTADDTLENLFAADELDVTDLPEEYRSGKPIVLVIDDNQDLLLYIGKLLDSKYSVITASNGEQGVQRATAILPDLIISDVMMPGIDGLELVRRLKNTVSTSHIPIILLTAKAIDEQRKEGYESGADSYLLKPFNSGVLLARVDNLLSNRKILKVSFEDGMMLGSNESIGKDEQFISKLSDYVGENLSNSELCIDDICSVMGLSRTQLYRKVKSLNDMSPNEFVRIYRLKRAKQMLVSDEVTIAEVGYRTGFSSPSYFIKCYREYFKETPSDHKKNKLK